MADWTSIPNAAVAKGGLPSGETMTAIRDNIVAQAEGAPSAPKTVARALGGLYLGAVEATGMAGLSDVGDFSEIAILGELRAHYTISTPGARLSIRFSTDNGSSWESTQHIINTGTATFICTALMVNLETGAYAYVLDSGSTGIGSFTGTGTLTVPAGVVNAFQIETTSDDGSDFTQYVAFAMGGKSL